MRRYRLLMLGPAAGLAVLISVGLAHAAPNPAALDPGCRAAEPPCAGVTYDPVNGLEHRALQAPPATPVIGVPHFTG